MESVIREGAEEEGEIKQGQVMGKGMGNEECRTMRAIKSFSLIGGNFCWARQKTHAVRKRNKPSDQILMCEKCCLSLLSLSGMYFLPLPIDI